MRIIGVVTDDISVWVSFSYTQESLDEFVVEGGFKFLPKTWQGASGDGWHLFLFHTLKLTEKGLKRANLLVLAAYLVLAALISILFRSKRTLLPKSVGRLVATHGMIVLLAMYALRHVGNTSWAKNIRNERAYRLPDIDDEPYRPPATLPTKEDVLITPDYASDFLGGYGRVLDYGHPGNRRWKDLTGQHASGYEHLTPSMQRELSTSIALWVQEESRRFLVQNEVREWAQVTDMNALTQLCHRELLMASDTLTEALTRQLDSLKAETAWGRWHDMAIHRTIIPAYLQSWEKRIVPPLASKTTGQARSKISSPAIFTALAKTFPKTDVSLVRTRGLPAAPRVLQEPHPLAWLSEGDTVEGMYKCKHNGKLLEVQRVRCRNPLILANLQIFRSLCVNRVVSCNCDRGRFIQVYYRYPLRGRGRGIRFGTRLHPPLCALSCRRNSRSEHRRYILPWQNCGSIPR
jgi:hypothetical protein